MAATTTQTPFLAHNENLESVSDFENAAAPPLSTPGTLARFEFGDGKGNEGTKVLMVEWTSPTTSTSTSATTSTTDWTIQWPNKKAGTYLEAFDRSPVSTSPSTTITNTNSNPDNASEGGKQLHKVYILLLPHVPIPRLIRIVPTPSTTTTQTQAQTQTLQANPLPAIFTGTVAPGTKGILHTLWAKSRLETLEAEIERESLTNAEGIALVMALQEREWIHTEFLPSASQPAEAAPQRALEIGEVGELKPLKLNTAVQREVVVGAPTSPLTPGGGRLAEKLKGMNMKLGTSDAVLNTPVIKSQAPPDSIKQQQASGGKGVMNLDAVLNNGQFAVEGKADEEEKELFSIALSPRTADMAMSPFSMRTADVVPWR